MARRSGLATRYLACAAGASLAIALCFIFGLLKFLDGASARADARQFGVDTTNGCIVGGFRGDQFDQRQYERIVLARVPRQECFDVPAPPGLNRFPEPGEVFVSPALAKLRDSNPVIAERYPTITGTISRDGLLASNELRIITGGDSEFYDRTVNVITFNQFGSPIDWTTGYLRIDSSSLLSYGVLFCVPLSIWLIYVATLVNAKIRERQLGVLAVVGLDAATTCRALITETVITVGAGAVIGVGTSKVLLRTLTPTFTGLQAFPGDYEPNSFTLVWVVLAVAAVAGAASALAALRSVYFPRHSDRGVRGRPVVAAVVLAVGVGTGLVGLLSFRLRGMRNIVLAGEIVTFFGLVLIVPVLARLVGGLLRRGRSASGEIVGSRLCRPSGSLHRAVAAFSGGLFVVCLAQTTVAAVVEDPQGIADQYRSDGGSLLLVRYPSEAVLQLLQPYDGLAGSDPASDDPQVLHGACQTVREATGSTGPCPDSGIYFTYQQGGLTSEVLNRLAFPAVAESPSGPRGDQLLEQVVRLTEPGNRIVRPDTLYVPLPVDAASALYNRIIAADQDINVRIAGAENVTGTSELNSIADVFRWGGYFAVVSSLIGAGVAVVALAHDRRLATHYLEVLGLSRGRSEAALLSELLLVSVAAAWVTVVAAWIWGAVYAAGRDAQPVSPLTMSVPFVVGLTGMTAVCLATAAAAFRSTRTAVVDGDADAIGNLRPFAVDRSRLRSGEHLYRQRRNGRHLNINRRSHGGLPVERHVG